MSQYKPLLHLPSRRDYAFDMRFVDARSSWFNGARGSTDRSTVECFHPRPRSIGKQHSRTNYAQAVQRNGRDREGCARTSLFAAITTEPHSRSLWYCLALLSAVARARDSLQPIVRLIVAVGEREGHWFSVLLGPVSVLVWSLWFPHSTGES